MTLPNWVKQFTSNRISFLSQTEGENQHIIDIHMHLMGAEQYKSRGGTRNLGIAKSIRPLHAIVRINCKVQDNFKEYQEYAKHGITNYPSGSEQRSGRRNGITIHAVSQIIDEAPCPLKAGTADSKGAGNFLSKRLPGQKILTSNRVMTRGSSGHSKSFGKYYRSRKVTVLEDRLAINWGWFKDSLKEGVIAHKRLIPRNRQPRTVVPWFFAPFDPRRNDCLRLLEQFLALPGCIGVKLYSRNGWSPNPYGTFNLALYGNQLGRQINNNLNKLYKHAVNFRIPLLNHTSPGGWPPEGSLRLPENFINFCKRNFSHLSVDNNAGDYKGYKNIMEYKYDSYTTDPKNWEAVLKKHPNAKHRGACQNNQ